MPRDAEQILLDRLLARAAVAKIPLKDLLDDKQLAELSKIQKKITADTKEDKIAGLNAILKVLSDQLRTPTVAARIQESFMKEGALSQKAALEIIYPQDPKLVIPVIIKIIENLLEQVKKRQLSLPGTQLFIEAALKKVKEVDEKQNWSKAAQSTLIFELEKKKIRADMQPLIAAIDKVVFLEDEALTWFEAILWIEGHFLREHTKALAMGNGNLIFIPEDPEVVAPLDDEDQTLCYGKGIPVFEGNKITKHFINSHFHALAVLLERKIKQDLGRTFTIVDVFPTSIVKESAIQETTTISKAERQEGRLPSLSLLSPDVFSYNTIPIPDGRLQLTTFIPANCPPERVAEAMKLFTKAIKGESIIMADPQARREILLSRLKHSQSQKVADKNLFGVMILALKDCTLADRDEDIIHSHMPEFEVFVDQNYTKASRSGYRIRLYGDRAHANDVKNMFEYFKAVSDAGKRKTTLEIVTYMQGIWLKANSEGSTLLYLVLEELIREMRDKLILHLDSELRSTPSVPSPSPSLKKVKQQ